jgi:Holliday junction resolvase
MTEQQIQKKIYDHLVDQGCYVVKVISASKSGVPDLIGCYEGRFFAIEVKTPKTINNVSKLQEYNIDKIFGAGGQALVKADLEDLDTFLKGLLDAAI